MDRDDTGSPGDESFAWHFRLNFFTCISASTDVDEIQHAYNYYCTVFPRFLTNYGGMTEAGEFSEEEPDEETFADVQNLYISGPLKQKTIGLQVAAVPTFRARKIW